MKRILGLDLGTNSIGWALVNIDDNEKPCSIQTMGSRIIPMGQELSKFEQGQAQTKNANRRIARGSRKLNKRYKQRRNKLIYVLQQLDMLPEQIKLKEPFNNPNKIDRISILPIANKQKQYTALDLLELRVNALHNQISLKELGRIIYLLNQLRGYSGGGNEPEKEENEDENSENEAKKGKESYIAFGKILSISEPEKVVFKNKELNKYKICFETEEDTIDGETFLDILKINDSLELLVNITYSKKNGETKTFKLPNKSNWRKKMENLEKELSELHKEYGREIYLSEYFLSILKENRWAKIRNNVILRSRYQSEFDAIWKEQSKYYPILNNCPTEKLSELLRFIFPGTKATQEKYRNEGLKKGLGYIIRNQIIYHQRELKDQSNLISDCRYEKGEKAVAKSHPVFQEFKIWEQINKLVINTKIEDGKNRKGEIKYKYIDKPIPASLKEWIYDELQIKKEIGFGVIFNKLKKEYKLRDGIDFLNGMNPKAKLKGDETKLILKKALGEEFWNLLGLNDKVKQIVLWDILYNAKGNEYEITSERTSKVLAFIQQNLTNISEQEQFAIKISKIKFSRNYASLSLKAIENILPLVRCGKYFDNQLSETLNEKITYLYNENVSDPFEKAAQEYLTNNIDVLVNGGIMNAFATILVYGKHTAKEYNKNEQINSYKDIHRLNAGELRNPLVEQLISETLMVVKDIWREIGDKPDEIRLELARELKNNSERRAKIYDTNNKNQKSNEEVKNLLIELKQELTLANIEKYKIWASQENMEDAFIKAYKDPSKSEIEKMKLWREQGHISPYTQQPIPLSELFNRERYDIDHIIPQSRYFDDSFTNKVICEKSINKDKSNRTAMEYFEVGSSIPSVLSKENFIDLVNRLYQGAKRKNLLATKVPEDPIARQMKETQYISVRVKEELSKIVGNENIKTTTGGVTDYLRNQWGLTDKFKDLLKPRYEMIQPLLAESEYDKYASAFKKKKEEYEKKGIPFNELELSKESYIQSYNKNFIEKKHNKWVIKGWTKRIDHRHHAIDALTIACTEPSHIKRLNDLNKELQTWLDNRKKDLLPGFEGSPTELLDEILNLDEAKRNEIFKQIEKFKHIDLPWKGFPEDAGLAIKQIIISQKPKDKLLIQPDTKTKKLQIKIRGQLHEGTLYGKSQGVEAYRIPLLKLAGKSFATEKTIEKITNDYLKNIIKEHLEIDFSNVKEDAFSVEGILALNKKIQEKERITEWKRKGKRKRVGEKAAHTPISSIKIFYKNQNENFDLKKLATNNTDISNVLERMLDKRLKEKLVSHIDKNGGNCKTSFSPKGIADFNNDLEQTFSQNNSTRKFKPIKKIKLKVDLNAIEQENNEISLKKLERGKAFNNSLYVSTGDNYLFAVMEKDSNRIYDLITFFDAANLLKKELNHATDKSSFNKDQIIKKFFEEDNENTKGATLLFTLKQGDPIYMPSMDENVITDIQSDFWQNKQARSENIYYVTKFSGNRIYFIKHNVATPILNGKEFGSQNAIEIINGRSIKQNCLKLNIDRLGNIIEVIN